MPASKQGSVNNVIMLVVVIAGLACGAVIAAHLTGDRTPTAEAQPPVLESQRLPWRMIHPEEGPPVGGSLAGDEPEPGSAAAAPAGGETETPPEPAYDPADQRVIKEAKERGEQAGVTEYVELTEDLFIRLSAKTVIMASTLEGHPDAKKLLVDFQAQLLADARVNPDEWYDYAMKVASDPVRAREIGEKILREADKHSERRITVSDVPGITPMDIPDAGSAQQPGN